MPIPYTLKKAPGKDGEILGKIAKYAFGFAVCMSVLVYVGTLILG